MRPLMYPEHEQQRTVADSFRGPWLAGTSYQRGDLAQRSSALWVALQDNTPMPGADPSWRKIA